MSLSVEPTTACNLRCPECPSGLRSFTRPYRHARAQTAWLSNLLLSGPKAWRATWCTSTCTSRASPTCNPGMDELVAIGKREGLYVSTSTNAHHIDAERAERIVLSGIDRLIISIDGADQEAYASYRVGGKIEKVLDATRHVLDAKRKLGRPHPHVVWQFLVVGINEHQLPTMRAMARQWGVDEFVVKTAQLDAPERRAPAPHGRPPSAPLRPRPLGALGARATPCSTAAGACGKVPC